MIAELIDLLVESTLALSAAAALVLVLRRPVRRIVGARGAYALWLLLPIAGLAVLVPARTVTLTAPPTASVTLIPIQTLAPADVDAAFDAKPLLIGLWSLGAIGLGLALGWQQRRFRRALGRLRTRADGSWQADNVDAGPAVIGLLRGRIVLPADFDSRYTDLERDLVLRHERVHLARRDPLANLAAAAMRCLYWFNPLLHYAAGRFRFDQELAVDAAVLAQRPEARRSYADAMLKTQLMLDPPPLGCHWQSAHPLKERIAMLKHPLPSAARIAAGFAFALVLSATTGYVAWASQPERVALPADDRVGEVLIEARLLRAGEVVSEGRFDGALGSTFELGDAETTLEFVIERITASDVLIASTLRRGDETSQPKLLIRRGERGSFALMDSGQAYDPDSAKPADVSVEFGVAGIGADEPSPAVGRENGREHEAPRYPKDALVRGVSGKVVLKVDVSAEGKALQAELDREASSPDIDASLVTAALDAVNGWTFEPARNAEGQAIAGSVLVPVTFSPSEKEATSTLPIPPPRLVTKAEEPFPMPTYNRIVPPKYPKAAIDEKREGKVLLRVLVGADGLVQQVEVESTSGSADLDEAAKATVRGWKFNAAHDGYKALSAWIGVPVDFSLTEKSSAPPSPQDRALEEIYVRPQAATSYQSRAAGGSQTTAAWTTPPIDRWLQRLSSPTNANAALSLAEAGNETDEC